MASTDTLLKRELKGAREREADYRMRLSRHRELALKLRMHASALRESLREHPDPGEISQAPRRGDAAVQRGAGRLARRRSGCSTTSASTWCVACNSRAATVPARIGSRWPPAPGTSRRPRERTGRAGRRRRLEGCPNVRADRLPETARRWRVAGHRHPGARPDPRRRLSRAPGRAARLAGRGDRVRDPGGSRGGAGAGGRAAYPRRAFSAQRGGEVPGPGGVTSSDRLLLRAPDRPARLPQPGCPGAGRARRRALPGRRRHRALAGGHRARPPRGGPAPAVGSRPRAARRRARLPHPAA